MFYLTTHSTHFIYGYMASAVILNACSRLKFLHGGMPTEVIL